jgi:hypothetical protein
VLTTTAPRVRTTSPALAATIAVAAVGAVVFSTWIATSALSSPAALIHQLAPAVIGALVVWMFFSERYTLTLAVLLIYLGLFDGFVKLEANSTVATLGRDALLYAIVLGATVRAMMRRTPLPAAPLVIGVLAWLLVCVAQIANPAAISPIHAAAGIRQHIEFVPLFFFGYVIMRSERPFIGLFALLIVIAAINGVVALAQSELTPAQLATWGPGFAKLMVGTTTTSSRTFLGANGVLHVRPPALGSDFGFGGEVAALALPGALVMIAATRRLGRVALIAWIGLPFVVLAVVTSQSRSVVVGAILAVVVFMFLTIESPRRGMALLAALLVAAAVTSVVVDRVTSDAATSSNRYATITPARVVGTTVSYRQATLGLIPTYAVDYPFGAGMGTLGPAANSSIGGAANSSFDGESEFTFLEIEVGLPGLLVMLGLWVGAVYLGLRLRRVADRRIQRPLMALTAIVITLFTGWLVGSVTAQSPDAPFFWFAIGALAYWFQEVHAGRVPLRTRFAQAAFIGA